MAQWLVKEEPEHYAYDQLEKDRKTVWAGVRNPLAQKHLRSIRKAIGSSTTTRAKRKPSSPSHVQSATRIRTRRCHGKAFVVDVAPEKKLARPVTLAEIKADRAFADFPLVRMSRLSVMPVTDEEWARIEKMSRGQV